MTDTYLLPEVHIVITQTPGVDGTPNTARLTQIENDLAEIMGRPAVEKLTDIPDVAGDPANGQVPVWNEGDEEWQPGDVGLPLSAISWGGSTVQDNIRILNFIQGLEVNATTLADLPGLSVRVIFAGTGSANSASHSDHTHTNPVPVFQPFNASGYMSGSSRQVVSESVTLAAGIRHVVKATFRPQMRGADSGAGYFTMTVNINGNSRTSPGGQTSGFWTVQGVPKKEAWSHAVAITGTGAAITVTGSITYHSGAGFNVDAGDLEIDIRADR